MSLNKDKYDVAFDFVRFISFLKENNIITTAIAAILSDRINEVTNIFVNSVVMPFINIDLDNDGKEDIKKLEDVSVNVFSAKLEIGKLIYAIIKFVIIMYVVFIISKLLKFGNIIY